MSKEKKARRAIELEGTGVTIELEKVVCVSLTAKDKCFISLEKLPSGGFRLIYTDNLIQDISKFTGMRMIREE
jgi:hypothetical protein